MLCSLGPVQAAAMVENKENTMTNTQAAERQAKHECLMREMVEALEGVVKAWDEMFYPNDYGGYEVSKSDAFEAYRAFDNARAALARAKEQQQ